LFFSFSFSFLVFCFFFSFRNGAKADCNNAFTKTLPWLADGSDEEADYKDYLELSKCDASNQPDATYWGAETDTIQVSVGDTVAQGDTIAFAGNTGPGGKRGSSTNVNTHLHLFVARRLDGLWYLVDPYGIYGMLKEYKKKKKE
jgi:hypothetical protein